MTDHPAREDTAVRPVLLALRGVTRAYAASDRPALQEVNLTVHTGDFISIMGPSGSGKSTLLNILGLLDKPDAGTYQVGGEETRSLTERERDALRSRTFGFVFQSSHVLGDQTVASNAALGLRIQHVPVEDRYRRAGAALDLLGLNHRVGNRAKLLSGGERQRLAIARAVATEPAVVLADEPTGNLDSRNGELVISHLEDLHAAGTTIILITHDEEIARRAPRRLMIADGWVTELHSGAETARSLVGRERAPGRADIPRTPRPDVPPQRRSSSWMDDAVDSVSSLSSRFLRTLLLMAAFAVGIGGLIAAVGLSQTAAAQVSARLTAAALDEVTIDLPQGAQLLSAADGRLRDWTSDVSELPHVQQVGHLAIVSPSDAMITRLNPGGTEPSAAVTLASASDSYIDLSGMQLPTSSETSTLDTPGTRLAWVSSEAARALEVPLTSNGILSPGYQLWINGTTVDVAGTFEVSDRVPELTTSVLVTPDVLAGLDQVQLRMVIRTDPGFPYPVAQAVPLTIAPEAPGSMQPRTVADLRDLRAGVADDLGAFIGVLSTVLLVLAVISASTAMYLSVQSRTQEIALRRAIGSGRGLIARLFILEGTLVGLAGGATGAAVGTATILAVSHLRGWTAVLPATLLPLALVLGLAAGMLSSLYPGWVASRQKPADALRG